MKALSEIEREKYASVWQIPSYAGNSPGVRHLETFLRIAKPNLGHHVLDIGAGDGQATRKLKSRGLSVHAFDLVSEQWPHADIRLSTGSLWRMNILKMFDYGYCCDVMEHIPTEFVALSIDRILAHCAHAFFSISFSSDDYGRYVGAPLHLTIKPFTWWRDMLRELGTLHDARDLIGEGLFYVGR